MQHAGVGRPPSNIAIAASRAAHGLLTCPTAYAPRSRNRSNDDLHLTLPAALIPALEPKSVTSSEVSVPKVIKIARTFFSSTAPFSRCQRSARWRQSPPWHPGTAPLHTQCLRTRPGPACQTAPPPQISFDALDAVVFGFILRLQAHGTARGQSCYLSALGPGALGAGGAGAQEA